MVAAVVLHQNVFADTEINVGGGGTEGGGSCSGGVYVERGSNTYHNCCAKGASCPHWMSGTGAEFKAAWNAASADEKNAVSIDVGDLNKCMQAKGENSVVWVGTDAENTKIFTNWHSANTHKDYKADFSGWLNGHGSEVPWNATWDTDEGKFTIQQFKDMILYIGHNIYAANGSNEYNLAFFCVDMIGNSAPVSFTSQSAVRITAALPDLDNMKLSDSQKAAYTDIAGKTIKQKAETEWNSTQNTVTLNVYDMLGNRKLPVAKNTSTTKPYVKVEFRHSLDIASGSEVPTAEKPATVRYKIDINIKENINGSWITKRSGSDSYHTATFTNDAAQTVAELTQIAYIPNSGLKAGTQYKICERITYSKSGSYNKDKKKFVYSKNESGEIKEAESYACAVFTPGSGTETKEEKEVVSNPSCANLGSNAVWSKTHGRSDGQSWVKKSTTSYSHLVYARPNDQVSFLHCYYPYAHAAEATMSVDGGDQDPNPGGAHHGAHSENVNWSVPNTCSVWNGEKFVSVTSADQCGTHAERYYPTSHPGTSHRISRGNINDYCELKASITPGNGGNYLFTYGDKNKNEKLCNGDQGMIHDEESYATYTVTDNDRMRYQYCLLFEYLSSFNLFGGGSSSGRAQSSCVLGSTRTVNVVPTTFYSPYQNSTDFKCNNLKKGYYQIVGVDPRAQCATGSSSLAKVGTNATDVGRTIQQWIYFGGTVETSSYAEPEPYPAYHTKPFYYLSQRIEGYRNGTPAKVVVPFNFNTVASVSGGGNAIVYGGEPVSVSATVAFTPRMNPDVTLETPYATITPDGSQVKIVQFTLNPSVPNPGDLSGGITDAGDEGSIRRYISGKVGGASLRGYVSNTVSTGPYNRTSNINGQTISAGQTYTVPDDEAGVKYCVAVAVYPADSHNKNYGTDLDGGANADGSGLYGTNWRWRVSDIKCRTIAKKPNFQVWGAGVFSNGGIVSSTSPKCVGWTLSTATGCGDKRTFGSWTEAEAVANGVITNFSSSNGYGYGNYFMRRDYYNTGTTSGVPGGYGGSLSNVRDVSKQTINNTGTIGYANISVSSDILERIMARYSVSSPAGYYGGAYDSNTAYGTYGPISLGAGSGTVVIRSTNPFTINHNITVADGPYRDIADIPQVVIVAPEIYISGNVTRVDAWLIATNGAVDTCKEFQDGDTSASGPCSQMLTVNGPVFAKGVALHRTAGAGTGNNSINPAERFNLSAANYFWAYAQAEDKQQAFTTYTRELAPRY